MKVAFLVSICALSVVCTYSHKGGDCECNCGCAPKVSVKEECCEESCKPKRGGRCARCGGCPPRRSHPPMAGGISDVKPADAETQNQINMVKVQLEELTEKDYVMFKAIEYRQQLVAGLNKFVQVRVGEGCYDYIILRIFIPLPEEGSVQLRGYKLDQFCCAEPDSFPPNVPVPP